MIQKSLPYVIWYEAINCWTDPGECNNDHPTEVSLGIFAKKSEAEDAGKAKRLDKFLTEYEYDEFRNRRGHDGCYIKEHLVVFIEGLMTRGRIVSQNWIELTSTHEARRQAVFSKARELGIPSDALDIEKLEKIGWGS